MSAKLESLARLKSLGYLAEQKVMPTAVIDTREQTPFISRRRPCLAAKTPQRNQLKSGYRLLNRGGHMSAPIEVGVFPARIARCASTQSASNHSTISEVAICV
jgi:hypothetical protein